MYLPKAWYASRLSFVKGLRAMQEYDINGFLFRLPVWVVIGVADGDLGVDGFAHCIIGDDATGCLFTDEDLAQTHKELLGTEGLVVAKVSEESQLINILLKLDGAGFHYVTFDGNIKSGRLAHHFLTSEVVAQICGA